MKKGLGALGQGELARGLGLLEQGELVRGLGHRLHLETPFPPEQAWREGKKVKTKSSKELRLNIHNNFYFILCWFYFVTSHESIKKLYLRLLISSPKQK